MIGAAEALAKSLQAATGRRKVVCRRGSQAIELTIVPGQTTFDVASDATPIVEQFQSRDFLVFAAEYAFGGVVGVPAPGDKIDETIGETTSTYEVTSPVPGGRPYRYSDTDRTILRIYSKQVATRAK